MTCPGRPPWESTGDDRAAPKYLYALRYYRGQIRMDDDGGSGGPDRDDEQLSTEDPLFLFTLFRSDVIGVEVDWERERFLFYPVNSVPDPRE